MLKPTRPICVATVLDTDTDTDADAGAPSVSAADAPTAAVSASWRRWW
ncbi:hypothetical protein [Streptomyces misionensis]|nr:hypothetical protein [Streptomyces misionensis]